MHRTTTRLAAAAVFTAGCGAPAPSPTPQVPPHARPVAARPLTLAAPVEVPCAAPELLSETVRDAPGATSLTADDRDIFWSDGSDVWSAPLEGGAPRKVLENLGAKPIRKLRVAGEHLFVLQKDEAGGKCVGRVAVAPRAGGSLQTVGGEGCVRDFDVGGDWVVYTTQHNVNFETGLQGTLFKARADGGEARDLFNLFPGITNVVTDGKDAYLGLKMDQLHRVALKNGAAVVLHEGIMGENRDGIWHTHFAVDARHVFFGFGHINLKGAIVYRMAKEPGAEPVSLGRMFPPIGGAVRSWPQGDLLQTETHLVWGSPTDGRVLRVAKDGHCPVEEIAAGRKGPDYATPAGKYVVWIDREAEPRTIGRRRVAR